MELSSVNQAIEEIKKGRFVIIVDNENRENEGDLAIAAEKITADAVNFMTLHGRGLICLPINGTRLDDLEIPLMVRRNTGGYSTAFTTSVDAAYNITTGISAADRAQTIRTMASPAAKADDLVQPGHIFPLRAREGGVLEREGHTEAIVDLALLAGLYPAGVLCEILNGDGTMARRPQLEVLAKKFGIRIVSIDSIIEYRKEFKRAIELVPANAGSVLMPAA